MKASHVNSNPSKPEREQRETPDAATAKLDLLTLPFGQTEGLARSGGVFHALQPWPIARFGSHRLKPGWWVFVCEGERASGGVELRMTAATDPLIVIGASQAEGRTDMVRVNLPEGGYFNISLLLSAWPGEMRFTRLALRRLGTAEVAAVLAAGAKRLLFAKNRFRKVSHLVRSLISGRRVELRQSQASQAPVAAPRDERPEDGATSERTLRIVAGQGFHAVLDDDQTLHLDAMAIAAETFQRDTSCQLLRADVIEGGRIRPLPARDVFVKPQAAAPALPLFIRGAPPPASYSRADLASVVSALHAKAARRIALPLASRDTRPASPVIRYPLPVLERTPLVSIIIPTKDRVDLLQKCFEGLSQRTGYDAVEVVVVNNGSTDPRLPVLLEEASRSLKLVQILDPGPFNFSRLNNVGVRASSGEIVLLLNDDVEPIETGWLTRMVESAMAPGVGAVGARLLYPDRTIQHAGVTLGIGGIAGHLWKGMSEDEAQRFPFVALPGERMAVTAACLAVRRAEYDEVGGLDEEAFPVALNDVDFCMRLRAQGYRNIYRGDAALIHRESQSRGDDTLSAETRRRLSFETGNFLKRWSDQIGDDPFSSPAFDIRVESGAVNQLALAAWAERREQR